MSSLTRFRISIRSFSRLSIHCLFIPHGKSQRSDGCRRVKKRFVSEGRNGPSLNRFTGGRPKRSARPSILSLKVSISSSVERAMRSSQRPSFFQSYNVCADILISCCHSSLPSICLMFLPPNRANTLYAVSRFACVPMPFCMMRLLLSAGL